MNTKEKILKAAVHLFFEQGYGSCSMRHLAAEVKLEASSLYNHFPSKQAILAEVCIGHMERLIQEMDAIVQLRRSPVGQMEKFVEFYLHYQIQEWEAFQVAQSESKHLTGTNLSQFKKFRKTFEQNLLDLINRGIDTGKFYDLPADLIHQTLLASMRWRANSPKKLEKALAKQPDALFHVILKGFVKK